MSRYTKATDVPRGVVAKRVGGVLDILADCDGPKPFSEICDELGIENHASRSALLPAMYALEFVGAIDRYTFVGTTGTRSQLAFEFTESVEALEIEDVLS